MLSLGKPPLSCDTSEDTFLYKSIFLIMRIDPEFPGQLFYSLNFLFHKSHKLIASHCIYRTGGRTHNCGYRLTIQIVWRNPIQFQTAITDNAAVAECLQIEKIPSCQYLLFPTQRIPVRSFTISPAIISPATDGQKALLPGVLRLELPASFRSCSRLCRSASSA